MNTIRKATHADVDAIVSIIKNTFALACPPDAKATTLNDYVDSTLNAEKIAKFIDSEHYFFVVEVDAQVAGMCLLEKIDETHAEFSKLYLSQNFHGLGLGKLLSEYAINHAKNNGLKKLILFVYANNTKAKSLYKKLGFKFDKKVAFHIGDEVHDDEKFILELS